MEHLTAKDVSAYSPLAEHPARCLVSGDDFRTLKHIAENDDAARGLPLKTVKAVQQTQHSDDSLPAVVGEMYAALERLRRTCRVGAAVSDGREWY